MSKAIDINFFKNFISIIQFYGTNGSKRPAIIDVLNDG